MNSHGCIFIVLLLAFIATGIVNCQSRCDDQNFDRQKLIDAITNRVRSILASRADEWQTRLKEKIKSLKHDRPILNHISQAKSIAEFNQQRRRDEERKLENLLSGKCTELVNRTEHQNVELSKEIRKNEQLFNQTIHKEMENFQKDVESNLNLTSFNMSRTMESKLTDIRREIAALHSNEGKVSFSASLFRNVRATNQGTIPCIQFDNFMSKCCSDDHGYSSESGVFTAPFDGAYGFMCSFLVARGYVNLQIKKNGYRIGHSYSAGKGDFEKTGMISATLELKQGDNVTVEGIPGYSTGIFRGDLYSTFSGYML